MTTPLFDPMHGWLTKKYEIQETAANANAARDYAAANAANAEARNAGMLAAARANEMNAQAGHLNEQSAWLGPNAQSEIGQRNAYARLLGGQLEHTNATTDVLRRIGGYGMGADGTLTKIGGGVLQDGGPSTAGQIAKDPANAAADSLIADARKQARNAAFQRAQSKLMINGSPAMPNLATGMGMMTKGFLPSLSPSYQDTVAASQPSSSPSSFIQSQLRQQEPRPATYYDRFGM